jgi:hypothetical protein
MPPKARRIPLPGKLMEIGETTDKNFKIRSIPAEADRIGLFLFPFQKT